MGSKLNKEANFQRCTRCVMDNSSDPTITFTDDGVCNYCTKAYAQMGKIYFPKPDDSGNQKLNSLLQSIKEKGAGNRYDCIMGLSGGLDSSYLAYLGYKWGLRILAIHIDDGFDTDISKSNLEKLVQATGFDYEVITPDEEQYNSLTRAFMRAGVPNVAIPQDNILFAFLYKRMKENNIKYFLSGGNFALESILQRGNTHSANDVVNIYDINRKFGDTALDKLEFISTHERFIDEKFVGIKSPRPLNYIDYNRDRAFKELNDFCGFEYYGRKHLENILTAFIQLYWLPQKFGVDKRTSHLSSMIVSGQMTREQALKELDEPLYDEEIMNTYISVIKQKLKISDAEFEMLMAAELHQHTDYRVEADTLRYKIEETFINLGVKLKNLMK